MTDKPKTYNLAPKFARARADIDRRRKLLDAESAQLDADESAAAEIAKRYPEVIVEEEAEATSKPTPAKGRKTKRPNTGRPYKINENERIMAAERGTLEALAEALGRDYPGVLKHHEVLLRRQREAENADTPAPAAENNQTTNSPRAAEADELRSGQSDAAFAPDADPSVSGSTREAPSDSGIGERGEHHPERAEAAEPEPTEVPARPPCSEPLREPWMDPRPEYHTRQAELEAIARFEAERGITTCPGPGSAELAALPLTRWNNKVRKWGRAES